ncbi:competence protein ComK [Alkalibacillus sp. S2W]|uniref:competence protein ComK n=1 Tax=Alkalibacillus sp. S2W TaxID=3386553 RepID=UPI00398D4139
MDYIKKKKQYTINESTMVIKHFTDSVYKSRIYERETEYLCQQTPEEILNESCKRKGITTYDGRKKAVADVLQRKTRLPIPIEINSHSIFMPTTMKQRDRCDWFSYQYALDIKPSAKGDFFKTIVLTNRKEVDLEITFSTYHKQMQYAGGLIGYFNKKDDIS